MCLGVPGRVLSREPEEGLLMGRVDFGGVARKVCLEHVPDVQPGEYVLVHVGFALSKIDAVEAQKIFDLLLELDQLSELDDDGPQQEVVLAAGSGSAAEARKRVAS